MEEVEKMEKPGGGKVSKERVTVCSMADGSDKHLLLMIRKSKYLRCFSKDVTRLPFNYDSSANAWMTDDLSFHWLKKWNYQFDAQSQKKCLFWGG